MGGTGLAKAQGWRRHRAGEGTGLAKAQGWRRHRAGEDTGLAKTQGWRRDGDELESNATSAIPRSWELAKMESIEHL
jgi:hypothetical protein